MREQWGAVIPLSVRVWGYTGIVREIELRRFTLLQSPATRLLTHSENIQVLEGWLRLGPELATGRGFYNAKELTSLPTISARQGLPTKWTTTTEIYLLIQRCSKDNGSKLFLSNILTKLCCSAIHLRIRGWPLMLFLSSKAHTLLWLANSLEIQELKILRKYWMMIGNYFRT